MRFISESDEETFNIIDMAFNSKRADDRKEWLLDFDSNNIIQSASDKLTYTEFINKELIHFSNYDNIRSIPSLIDGCKPSHRKILFCSFKRNLVKEIRVAQLAGYVSEHGAYHHGEASLHGTIIGMAQNYVGHNNINYLEPIGQFGSRLKGGKDSAQPRYIHTHLAKLTNIIFNKLDNPLLTYNDDDGMRVEPQYYMPIIPAVLINGTEGIGTGWSSGIPKFNPIDIIANIKNMLNGIEPEEMVPWLRGFKGKITKVASNSWISKGVYTIIDTNTVIISELPLGVWTDNYKAHLDVLMMGFDKDKDKDKSKNKKGAKPRGRSAPSSVKKQLEIWLKDYSNESSESSVKFILHFENNILSDLINKTETNGLSKFESLFKMTSKISCDKKLVAYDEHNHLVCFKSVTDILKNYYKVRLDYYQKRKDYILNKMKDDILFIQLKVKFILDIINGKIIVNNKSKSNIYKQLEDATYPKMYDNKLYTLERLAKMKKSDSTVKESANYDFLIKMPIYNLTKERIEELKNDLSKIESNYKTLDGKTNKDIWTDELDEFLSEYKNYLDDYYKYMGFNKNDFKIHKQKKLNVRQK